MTILNKLYARFRDLKNGKNNALSLFNKFMPEIAFRTTKIEGEPVTRRMVAGIFNAK